MNDDLHKISKKILFRQMKKLNKDLFFEIESDIIRANYKYSDVKKENKNIIRTIYIKSLLKFIDKITQDITIDGKNCLKIRLIPDPGFNAGGQHVGMSRHKIKIEHIPTGNIVVSEESNYNHKCRIQCYKLLKCILIDTGIIKIDKK